MLWEGTMPRQPARQPSTTAPVALHRQRGWGTVLLHRILGRLLRFLVVLGSLLVSLLLGGVCLALVYGAPLLVAGVWVIYGLPTLHSWWTGHAQSTSLAAICAWLGGGFISGVGVFVLTQSLVSCGLAALLPQREVVYASQPAVAPRWRRTIQRRVRWRPGVGGQTPAVVELEETIIEEQV